MRVYAVSRTMKEPTVRIVYARERANGSRERLVKGTCTCS